MSTTSTGNDMAKDVETNLEKNMLRFHYEPTGDNGRITLTVRLGEALLAVDKMDIVSAAARERFAKSLCKDRPGIDRAKVDEQLLQIVRDVQVERVRRQATGGADEELDISRIVRPERFVLAEVSGLAVAVSMLRENRPGAKWLLMLRWADGRREVMALPESLSLPDGSRLWIHPVPSEPNVRNVSPWSRSDRKAWLAGSTAPDPAEVFQRLCKCVAYFVDFPDEMMGPTTAMLALWVLMTYGYPTWQAIPYLYLGGPAGSGKTRVFEVLSRLVFRPLQSSNMTAAALFRTLHSRGGTLLYDEAERLKQSTPDVGEINSMLLAGYKRGGRATRLEAVGDTFRTVEFDVYGPKALACIRGLPEALASRCISVMMFRAAKGSAKPKRTIDGYPDRWRQLQADLHALALEYGADLIDLAKRDHVCPAMSGRQFELWQPILSLASWIEDHGARGLLETMQAFALASNEAAQEVQTPSCDEMLLRMLADCRRAGESPIAKEILDKVRQTEAGLLAHWSAKGVATALRRYGVETRKTHGRRCYGHVSLDQLLRIQRHYGMDIGLTDPNEEKPAETPGDVPQVPQGHPDGQKRGL